LWWVKGSQPFWEFFSFGVLGGGGVHTSSQTTLKTEHWYPHTTLHTFLCQKIIMFLCIFCSIVGHAVCEIYRSYIIYSCVP